MRDRAGVVAAVAAAIVYAGAGWMRHTNYWSGGLDLGVFDQAAWMLSRGHAHVSIVGRNIFADHLSFVMLAFAPLYRIAATPAWLIGAQGVALGATVLPLRALAREVGVAPWHATVILLGSAPIAAAALFDFHPSTLAVPFIALALLAARREQMLLLAIACSATIVCRAELGWVLLAMTIAVQGRPRRVLAGVGLVGLLAGAALPRAFGSPSTWVPQYGHLGTGPIDALHHPSAVWSALVNADNLGMLVAWTLSCGFLVLLRPRWAAAFVVATLPVLFARWSGTKLPWFHYGAPFVPLLAAGALEALGQTNSVLDQVRPVVRRALLPCAAALGLVLFSPLSPRAPGSLQLWRVLRPQPGFDGPAAVRAIGPEESVSATSRVLSHLTHRERAYMLPLPFVAPKNTFPEGTLPTIEPAQAASVAVVITASRPSEDVVPSDFEVVHRFRGLKVLRRRGADGQPVG